MAVFIDIGAETGDTVDLTFNIDDTVMFDRLWNIKVTQLECTSLAA